MLQIQLPLNHYNRYRKVQYRLIAILVIVISLIPLQVWMGLITQIMETATAVIRIIHKTIHRV